MPRASDLVFVFYFLFFFGCECEVVELSWEELELNVLCLFRILPFHLELEEEDKKLSALVTSVRF